MPVIAPEDRNRPLTTLGTMTFPTATPVPASTVPKKSAASAPAPRAATPTATETSASSTTRSAPNRRASIGASGASTPKQRTGAAVRKPAAVAERSSSRWRSSTIGGTLATGIGGWGRVRTTPAASSGSAARLDAFEPDVVLRERRSRPLGRADVRELRELELAVELVAVLEPVEHRRHEPREVLRAPHAAQRLRGVALERRTIACVPRSEPLREHADVRDGEVETLRARRRNDVRGVAREKKTPVLHRLDHKAPHPRHALLEDLARMERPAREPEPALELVPDPLVRPLVQRLVRPHLGGQPRDPP